MLTMTTIDLTEYVVGRTGHWFENPEQFTPTLLKLTAPDDGLTLAGPVRVRVSVQAQNRLQLLGSYASVITSKELFGYVLDIPPGQTWTYPAPRFSFTPHAASRIVAVGVGSPGLEGQANATVATSGGTTTIDNFDPQPHVTIPDDPAAGGATLAGQSFGRFAGRPDLGRLQQLAPSRTRTTSPPTNLPPPIVDPFPGFGDGGAPGLGTNAGQIIVIRPAGHDACTDPCISVESDPCTPRRPKECSCHSTPCHCQCHGGEDDIPCDVAVENIPNLGTFFPASCEPCAPGASIGAPTLRGPSLIVRPANGGTVRTRYYNGMFITREDLETDQRNVRLKRALMNRAMGQGVVWGLNVCLDGDSVCVMPGYGVDCCGNDMVVTTPYRVDGAALVRDPAAAPLLSKRGPQRLHLVLEYFECPEQPRPVHGDPCSPDATRCETSRIRETTRLRLAPPCEVDDSGPIKDFLKEIDALKTDPIVGPLLADPAAQLAPAAAPQVPFDVTVTLLATNTSVVLAPKVTTDAVPNLVRDDLDISRGGSIHITLRPRAGFQFVSGNTVLVKKLIAGVPTDVNEPFMPIVSTPAEITWENKLPVILPQTIPVAGQEPIPAAVEYQLQNWKLKSANGVEIEAAATKIQLTRVVPREWRQTPWGQANPNHLPPNAEQGMHVQIPATPARVVARPPQWPCFSEACDPEGRPRFPVLPPWLHEDPTQPGKAADPKVIVLAVVYAWLAMIMTRDKIGTPNAINIGQFTLATAIYQAVWKLFFATQPNTGRYQLTDALQRLLQAWCRGLLYPGPKCLCEPHGVVIGCATVAGGTIQHVDPWGGRRWVVHYPLLAYWGQQFGIMPLDAIASKLFDFLCCVAHLPAPRSPRDPGLGERLGAGAMVEQREVGRASSVNLGRAVLLFGNERDTEAQMNALALHPTRVVSLGPVDFVTRFMGLMTAPAQPGERALVRYTVTGLPDVHLVAPGDEAAAPAPRPVAPGRLRELVRSSFARRTQRATVPPLLADFAEDLTQNLLTQVRVQPTADAQRPVVATLADAGVTTVGGLLGRNPTEVHEQVLGGENAAELASIIDAGEQTARTVSKAVGDAVVAAAAERRLVARTDVKSPEARADLTRSLDEKLKAADIAVSTEALAAAISSAAGEG